MDFSTARRESAVSVLVFRWFVGEGGQLLRAVGAAAEEEDSEERRLALSSSGDGDGGKVAPERPSWSRLSLMPATIDENSRKKQY